MGRVRCVVDRRHIKLSTRPRNCCGVPRDVTRDDVIAADEERDGVRVGTSEWRLSGLWIDESDACRLDPFIVTRPPVTADADAGDDDDDDDADCVGRRRRRSRPDLVPRQSSLPAARRQQDLNNTCDDVTVIRPLPHCHCVDLPSDVIT